MRREGRPIDDEVLAHISPRTFPCSRFMSWWAFGRAEPTRDHSVEYL